MSTKPAEISLDGLLGFMRRRTIEFFDGSATSYGELVDEMRAKNEDPTIHARGWVNELAERSDWEGAGNLAEKAGLAQECATYLHKAMLQKERAGKYEQALVLAKRLGNAAKAGEYEGKI